MKRSLLLACLLGVLSLTGCGDPTWTEQRFEEGGYRVLFPGEPEHFAQTLDTSAGEIRLERHSVALDGAEFTVGWVELPREGREAISDHERLLGARDGSLKEAGASLVREQELEVDGWPARDVLGKTASLRIWNRIVVSEERLYQVIAVYPSGEEAEADARRFRESFHLLAPAGDRWEEFRSEVARFRVEAPGRLSHELVDAATGEGTLTLHSYTLLRRGLEYSVTASKVARGAAGLSEAKQLEAVQDGTLERLGGRMLRSGAVKLGDVDGLHFVLETDGADGAAMRYSARIFLHGGRLYQAVCRHRAEVPLEEETARFLESVRPL